MHDGKYCLICDHRLYTTFRDALWDTLSALCAADWCAQYQLRKTQQRFGKSAGPVLGNQSFPIIKMSQFNNVLNVQWGDDG